MGRQRKHPRPRSLLAVAPTQEDAEQRAIELHRLAKPVKPAPGRGTRVDHVRDAMILADGVPPTPRCQWRRTRGKANKARGPVPRREACAVEALVSIYAERGENLTIANATRIIEQGRRTIDGLRGIRKEDRQVIEDARELLAPSAQTNSLPVGFTDRDWATIRRARTIIEMGQPRSQWDEKLRDRILAILRVKRVH
jgi:hypothetical protein